MVEERGLDRFQGHLPYVLLGSAHWSVCCRMVPSGIKSKVGVAKFPYLFGLDITRRRPRSFGRLHFDPISYVPKHPPMAETTDQMVAIG